MKVVVLAGGLSDERDVSLSSGSQIANALIAKGHEVLLMDAFFGFEGAASFETAYEAYGQPEYHAHIPIKAPNLTAFQAAHPELTNLVGPHVIEICQSADAVFLALHGGIGENGQIQALFDLYRISYTGTGYKGSAMAMDKLLAKKLCSTEDILSPEYWLYQRDEDAMVFAESIQYPVVVKPLDNGSSIGIQMVDTPQQLIPALMDAKRYSSKVLVEKKISGREFSVGILDGKALPVIEIIALKGFYDYTNKYQAGAVQEVTPAQLSAAKTREIQALAEKAHNILELYGYSRVDFMMGTDGRFYFIEANTLPGMTPTSLLPQEAAAKGISYPDLCQRLLESAFGR